MEGKQNDSLPPIEATKVTGSLMVPDDDSSDEDEGQSDSDSLGLDDDLGAIKVEVKEEKQIDSNDDDDFYEDQTVKNQTGQDNQNQNKD